MGRPFYSNTFRSTPAVRDPEPPSCEKWSYLNAFDPDSDEFFDNENAVYEDFIGPVTSVNPEVEMAEDAEEEEEEEEEEDEEEEEARDMLVVRMGNASPITSRSSESLLAVGAEDLAHLVVDAFHDIRQIEQGESAPVLQDPAVRIRLATRTLPGETRWASQTFDSGRSYPRRGFATTTTTTAAVRTVSNRISHIQRDESLPVPAPSAPIPVPAVSRRSATIDERILPSSSTPPRQTPMAYLSISPPPATTPRLYSWTRNPSHSASPSSGGPFTNPHARTSYASLSPALIRIRDVTV